MIFKFLGWLYTAGGSWEEAEPKVKALLDKGFSVTSDILGEFVKEPESVIAAVAEYIDHIKILGELQRDRGTGNIVSVAIKPSRIGLEISQLNFQKNLMDILRCSRNCGVFVWIDAEEKKDREAVLSIVLRMRTFNYMNIGLAIQCVHSDAKEVARQLWEKHIAIRLVMGAYTDCDLKKKSEIIKNFKDVFWTALFYYKNSAEKGVVALASHNSELVDYGRAFYIDQDLRGVIQFQMLYGIRAKLQRELVALGYDVLIYTGWGRDRFGFLMRRILEGIRPSALWLFLRNIPEAWKYGV